MRMSRWVDTAHLGVYVTAASLLAACWPCVCHLVAQGKSEKRPYLRPKERPGSFLLCSPHV
eukprot:590889-Amphidinium_carterae.1